MRTHKIFSITAVFTLLQVLSGRRMRVQVQPRFDGFQNQWTYPAPSC